MIVDIPDKICSHCGGTIWSVTHWANKPKYECNKREKERKQKWRINNINKIRLHQYKWKQNNKEYHKIYLKNYIRKTKRLYTEKDIERGKQRVSSMADIYIKQMLCKEGIIYSDIPQDLIELKRKQLKLKRYVKENSNK